MIPLMVEAEFKPAGWLGLLVGSRLYFNFHAAAIETEELFMRQMDLVERDLGDRGKAVSAQVSEGVPPRFREPEPEPAPTPAPAPAPAPTPAPAPARALAPAPAPTASSSPSSFTPSMPLLDSSAVLQRSTGDDASLVKMLLEREDAIRQEAKEQQDELRREMETMRVELAPKPPVEVITEQQIDAVQNRLEAMHAAKLLSEDEVGSLEDILADFIQLRATIGVVTMEVVVSNPVAGKAHILVSLAEGMPKDVGFARQVKRKLVGAQ
jgi:hypothetical protein